MRNRATIRKAKSPPVDLSFARRAARSSEVRLSAELCCSLRANANVQLQAL
jgi:hypothetical protein